MSKSAKEQKPDAGEEEEHLASATGSTAGEGMLRLRPLTPPSEEERARRIQEENRDADKILEGWFGPGSATGLRGGLRNITAYDALGIVFEDVDKQVAAYWAKDPNERQAEETAALSDTPTFEEQARDAVRALDLHFNFQASPRDANEAN